MIAGGYATNSIGYLGFNAGSVGTATVSSGTWANSGSLIVGNSGTGTLDVTGGSVMNSDGGIGINAGSVSTATVSGGTWASSGDLYVGYNGTGTLNVTGGSVTSSTGYISATMSAATAGSQCRAARWPTVAISPSAVVAPARSR